MHFGLGAYFDFAVKCELEINGSVEYTAGLTIAVDYYTNVLYSPEHPSGLVVAQASPSFQKRDPSVKAVAGIKLVSS